MKAIMVGLGSMLGLVSVTAQDLSQALELAKDNTPQIQAYLDWAATADDPEQLAAAEFLVTHMPPRDLASLDADFLKTNHQLAFRARSTFPWAKPVPFEVFCNDVLPYASLDETREPWRASFLKKATPIVAECKTTGEAAQALNREFFDLINVHYHTGRKRANQSPSESIKLGMATCTGLSIILVDACRAVGIPARIAGIASWPEKSGNHTWVEIWDDGSWHYTGADEYDEKGLNRAWFTHAAAKADPNAWQHAIWASSWRQTGDHFPMAWSPQNQSAAAVPVTRRYADTTSTAEATTGQVVYFRMFDTQGGQRITAKLKLKHAGKTRQLTTRSGRHDLNDMPSLTLPSGSTHTFSATHQGVTRTGTFAVPGGTNQTIEMYWDQLDGPTLIRANASFEKQWKAWLALPAEKREAAIPPAALTKKQATMVRRELWRDLSETAAETRKNELTERIVRAADKEMKYLERTFGEAENGKRSLWISLHGGGHAPARVNEQQWKNQIRLYEPEEGIVVAPRAPTDTWNMWHQAHIDHLLDRLIENYVLARGVDPNRVYLLGYSAGGDGLYQLAPRMADRLAAASMMAGHPNDASPLGLRNLPFRIFMGGKDAAHKRNQVAREWKEKLAALRQADPTGYPHEVTIYEELGHWMNGRDTEAIPWMAEHTRNPWPKQIVWNRHKKIHRRFYWLEVPKELIADPSTIRATIDGQSVRIQIDGDLEQLRLRLSDQLLDLDQPITVAVNDKPVFQGHVTRSVKAIYDSLQSRLDPASVATADLSLAW